MSLSIKAFVTGLGLSLAAPIISPMATAVAAAECIGENLFETLPAERKAAVETRAAAAPFAEGNLWQARRGAQRLTLVGTYHIADERHYNLLDELEPYWEGAQGLLVEATEAEERALRRALAEQPELAFITEGPTLLQSLPPDLWAELSAAMQARGVPSVMAAKYRPWFAALTLGFAPCAMSAAQEGGLDKLILAEAEWRGLPAKALEPYETLFTIFKELTPEEELQMIKGGLALEDRAEDVATTLADLYFSGQARLLWEATRELSVIFGHMSRAEVDADMARMEELTMSRRNHAWIAKLEEAAAEGPHIAAFGALHLAGENGVLNLLAQRGWALERLD